MLPNLSLIFAKCRPMFTKCQQFYTLGVRCILQECGDFTWRMSDCEELVGVTHRR